MQAMKLLKFLKVSDQKKSIILVKGLVLKGKKYV